MADVSALSPALLPVWRTVHQRLSSGRPVTTVRIGPLGLAARTAVADLLGLAREPGAHVTVKVRDLDEVLRDAVGMDTRTTVERLLGPLDDRAGDRRRAVVERARLWTWLETHPVVLAQPALREWVADVRRGGLIERSVSGTRAHLDRALSVLAQLPADGEPLPAFAERVLRDPHALDDGRCASLVVRALAALHAEPVPAEAAGRRALWERAGIASDELSSTVLVAGFRPGDGSMVAQVLGASARAGQAAVLTLAQLRTVVRWPDPPPRARVVENPAVLALALRRFGTRCPPLVCTSGWPSAAGMLCLRLLASAGTALSYHGDLDGDGLRIAAHVVARTGARPWRMSSADYLAAAAGEGPPVGRVTPVPWDDELAGHLLRVGTAVPEERVANRLLADLAAGVAAG